VKVVIAVIATLVLGVVAATIWVASRSYERTVVANPYESGIHHDADRKRAQALGWVMVVDEDALHAGQAALLAVTLSDRNGAPLDGAGVTFRVSRPGTSRFDRSAPARPEGRGRYVAVLPMTEAGFWDLDVVIVRGAESLTLGKWIHAAGAVGEGVHCDAGAKSCASDVGDLRIVLDLSPRPPLPLSELEAAVRLTRGGAPVSGAEVAVLLSMPGMYMGENRIPLSASGDGRYAGKGVLLRCATGRRDWVADVVVRLPDAGEPRARFAFQVAE
jgi:nitrogen fixation protein FixH